MQRILILIYTILTATIAITSTILEVQPALFFINIFAPHEGDSYSINLVLLLTWIILLSPVFVFMIVSKLLRKKSEENISTDRTGIFVTRKKAFQSSMVGIPILINNKQAGIIDNGRTKFFDTPLGTITIQAGKGKQASEKIQINIAERQQLKFEMKIKQTVFTVKFILMQI